MLSCLHWGIVEKFLTGLLSGPTAVDFVFFNRRSRAAPEVNFTSVCKQGWTIQGKHDKLFIKNLLIFFCICFLTHSVLWLVNVRQGRKRKLNTSVVTPEAENGRSAAEQPHRDPIWQLWETKKKILQDSLKWIKCLKIYLLVSSSLMNCGEFIRGHLKYKTFLVPVRNSLCWFIRSCIIPHVPGFVSPKCDSSHIHNYLTWRAHSSFLDPLTSLVTEYISCLITSALFYIKNDYASTAELTRWEKKWKDVKKRFGCAERIFFHNKTVAGRVSLFVYCTQEAEITF